MKRTRKWAYVEQEAQRLASIGLSAPEIAQQLGVNRSTITRWMQQGKLTRTESSRRSRPVVEVTRRKSPAEWAASVRAEYALNETDDQLVSQAEAALALSFEATAAPHVRLNATRTFQSLVRQLALDGRGVEAKDPEAPAAVEPEMPQRRVNPERPARTGTDPRLTLIK